MHLKTHKAQLMTDKIHPTRRNFLKKTAISLSAGLLAMLPHQAFAKKAASVPKENLTTTPDAKGYHETEHIKTYYQKARF
ncbi:MAG TPA: twin-arginine translocation signal domain-containing protein [Methylococcales bacterium]|nr:twin-arginine translocation signal domain-containing protein [Methylococcales bacterium]HIO45170.1 twin-arginine translocation signal domain-containing protein [Methylococcales bacterium]